jgi:signal transduction histidine kinase
VRAARAAAARTEAVLEAASERLAAVQGGAAGLPVVVLAANGTPLLESGVGPTAPPPEGARPLDVVQGMVVNGPLHVLGDNVYAWTVSAVDHGEAGVLGYVAAQMRVAGPASAARTVQEMTGEPLTMYVRDAVSGVWMAHPGRAAPPPSARTVRRGLPVHERAGRSDAFAAESPIAGTSWYTVVEAPVGGAHARAMAAVRPLALVYAVLLLLGGLVAWRYSRRITRPLAALTAGAEAISEGDYSRRVEVGQAPDELVRLAASFNGMAGRIERSGAELRQRAEEARAAWEQASAGDRAKGDFLAVMSHELRTPLNAIGGYAQLLEMELHGPITAGQRQALQRIALNQKHLLALVNDVLNYSRLGAGALQFALERVDVAAAFEEVQVLVEAEREANGLQLERDEPVEPVAVRADAERLRQILINLVSNAVKFTPPGGTITLRCVAQQDQVSLIVADTGIGIPPERLETIFEPFVQLDRTLNRPVEGVGLGLSISRDLASGMGGELRAENRPGGGTAFTLTLPRADAAGEQRALPDAVETGAHG